MEEIFLKLVQQAAEELLLEEIYIKSVKITNSGQDLAETLSNLKIITTSARTNIGVTGNAALIGLGAYTGGASLLQLGVATDRRARLCYKASFLFSSSAMVNGGFSILAKTCHISQAGIVSEAFGMAFLQLGNRAHNMALKFEGKNHLGQKTRPQSYSPDGLGFIMPRSDLPALSTILEKIPFQAIGQSIGISFTIYAYSKVVISGYRYGQQFVTKFKIKRRSRLLKKQAFFIIVRFSSVRCRFNHRIRLKKQLSPLFCAS